MDPNSGEGSDTAMFLEISGNTQQCSETVPFLCSKQCFNIRIEVSRLAIFA